MYVENNIRWTTAQEKQYRIEGLGDLPVNFIAYCLVYYYFFSGLWTSLRTTKYFELKRSAKSERK